MSAPRHVTMTDTGRARHVLVQGQAVDLLREHGHRAMWSAVERGWWLRRERVPDLLAQAAEAGVRVRQVVR